MKEVFACAEDTEIDVPRIWQYLAEVIGPMIKDDGALPLNFFFRATESVRLSRKVSHLIADVLLFAASQLVCCTLDFKLNSCLVVSTRYIEYNWSGMNVGCWRMK